MGTPYIYYIQSRIKGGTYIGQSRADGTKRIIQHFSGLYHYGENGSFVNTRGNDITEGTPFVEWLKSIPLETVTVHIFTGPYFGIPKQTWIDFISQWSTSTQHRNLDGKTKEEQQAKAWAAFQSMTDEAKLNMAEIIHIYNAKKRGYTLLQRQMGGQNDNLFKRGSNIVLNREASPEQMVNVIDADEGGMSNMQAVFDSLFKKDVLHNPQFIQRLKADEELMKNLKNNKTSAFFELKTLTDKFLQESAYGNTTRLEMLLNATKDKCKHSGFFTVSWPEKDDEAITIYRKGRNENYQTLVGMIASQIQKKRKSIENTEDLKEWADKFGKMLEETDDIYIGIGSFINLKLVIKYNGLTLFTPVGQEVDITSSLKRISYYYYAHFADMYYNQHQLQISGGRHFFDDNFNYYAQVKGETCTAFVYNKYREEGIRTSYMKNWGTWRVFNNGMLTVYTKNRGNSLLGKTHPEPRVLMEDDLNNEFVNIPAFVFNVDVSTLGEQIDGIPFYKVSNPTWDFVVSGYDMDIDQLEHY